MPKVDRVVYAVRPKSLQPGYDGQPAPLVPGEDVTSEGETWFHPYSGAAPYKVEDAPRFRAVLTDPQGGVWYLCHGAPGITQEPAAAIAFRTQQIASRAGHSAIYGEPNAFWESERKAAANTRARMKGWANSTEPVTDR